MLREITQVILSLAGVIAAFFVSPDSINFNFMQLGVVLVMMIFVALVIWFVPEFFRRNDRF